MALNTKAIKQKMKSVKNIGKITKAMEMISVSKMKRSVALRAKSFVYSKQATRLLKSILESKTIAHPLMDEKKGTKVLLLVVSSNKGLCGAYNSNISKQVEAFAKEHANDHIETIAIGKQSVKAALRNNLTIHAQFTEFSDYFQEGEIDTILGTLLEYYQHDEEVREVHMASTRFVSSLSFQPKVVQLLPFTRSQLSLFAHEDEMYEEESTEYEFEPNQREVLNATLPGVLQAILYQLLLDAIASEHSSRVIAMKNASDNASDLHDELKINFNRARQAAITQEIAEIVGGSSAMA